MRGMDDDMAKEDEAFQRDLFAALGRMGAREVALPSVPVMRCPECKADLPPGPGRAYDECPACHWVEGY